MPHLKWRALLSSAKLRKFLDRRFTEDSNKKDTDEQIRLLAEKQQTLQTTSVSSSSSKHSETYHPSFSPLRQPHLQHDYHHEQNSQESFNRALRYEFNDLFFFACNETFSGENVLFLRLIQCWKACWSPLLSSPGSIIIRRKSAEGDHNDNGDGGGGDCPLLRRRIFSVAVEIFHDFISPATACTVPLNLEDGLAAALEGVLGDAAKSITLDFPHQQQQVTAVPFAAQDRDEDIAGYQDLLSLWWDLVRGDDDGGIITKEDDFYLHGKIRPADDTIQLSSSRLLKRVLRVPTTVAIPETFCRNIFDAIESSVYLMVFRDTFPKYVSWRKLKSADGNNSVEFASF